VDVLVRGVPPEIHAALTVRAKARQMSLRGYIVDVLSAAVSVPSDAVPAAITPELLAMPDILAELAAATKRIEAHLSVPVGGEQVERVGPQSPAPKPEASAPVAVEPTPLALKLWPVGAARGLLAALDDVLNLTDAELAERLERQGISRLAFDAELERKLIEWLGARGEPRPVDPTEAMAALAAELRAALEIVAAEPAPPPLRAEFPPD
jgi:hypothetical protein